MFRGVQAINLDSKGRISIPARYRSSLAVDIEPVVITIDPQSSCLLLYPFKEWEKIEAKIAALPSFNPSARQIQRILLGHATEVNIDAQGRCLLAPLLRDYAHLNKSVMLVGQGRKLEIWDESLWQLERETWLKSIADEHSAMPEELSVLSL